ncbi:MAG: pentapeptide repeat-containing protein [Nostoc sp.]|uniref:pentapeptide repeat-containing protein n=1 Tax=Nostoc sp. TaxID=1180 RepID=UPI002FFD3C34
MTEEPTSNLTLVEQQLAQPVRTLKALLRHYAEGYRNFSGSDLRGVTMNIIDKEIKYLDLSEIILKESNLQAINCSRSELKVNLTGVDFSNCNLKGANLSGCTLDQCNFSNSDLRRANFSQSSCRGSDFIQAILQGIAIGYADFTASNFTGANLRSLELSGTFLHANFRGCNFQKATFRNLNSEGADFSDADLRGLQLPTPTTVTLRYSYYNDKTKFSENFDPIAMGMELLKDESDSEG